MIAEMAATILLSIIAIAGFIVVIGALCLAAAIMESPSLDGDVMKNQTTTQIIKVSDESVRAQITEILQSPMSPDMKYEALDGLTFKVWNGHPDHMTAKVLKDISAAIESL